MRRRAVLALLALAAGAQQPGVKFSTSTNLVIVDVQVRDKSGKPVENLEKADFTVLEDGKPQAISIFEAQRLEIAPLAPLAPAAPPSQTQPERLRQTNINIVAPNRVQYQNKRLLVMFFDFSSMPPADQIRAQQAGLEFIDEQMTAADMVAVMTFASTLRIEQDFTSDRGLLRDIIRSFRIGEASELAIEADNADTDTGEDTGAAFIADETEFNIFNTDRKLAALESAAAKLAALPEKKALVYFSSGVGKTGVENQSQLRATINAAVRANVSFYPVDARGLMASTPGGDAGKAAPRGTGLFSGRQQNMERERFNDQQETLSSLAADTGGKAFLDSNELSLGIVQAQTDIRSYYILGYYSTNPAADGRFRRIQVKLNNGLQAKLDYRSGYFAPKTFDAFNASDKERQLEEALMMGDPITDLPIALEIDYFRLTNQRYFVPVALKVPGSEISLIRKGGAEVTDFDFIGQIVDAKKKVVGSVRDNIRVKLTKENASQLARRSLQYDTGFTLPAGEYRAKFLVRENRSGKMGTFEARFTVPDVTAETKSLKVSSVVWSSQREALDAAVGTAGKQKKLLAMNPLVQEGHKLVPSITRVFRKDQNLYVYFEVYDPAADPADSARSVAATLSLFSGPKKVFETTPVRATTAAPGRQQTVPVQFQMPLAKLAPGRYTCQLNVVDEVGKRFAFPRAPLVLLP